MRVPFRIDPEHLQEILSYPTGWDEDFITKLLMEVGVNRESISVLLDRDVVTVSVFFIEHYYQLMIPKELDRFSVQNRICNWVLSWEM